MPADAPSQAPPAAPLVAPADAPSQAPAASLPAPASALLVDQLAGEIQARVATGEFAIGSWLRQERLAAEFKVSRTPVREALRKLASAEILELVPNRGALVRGPTLKEVRDAYVVRADLEGLAAAIAAERISPEELVELRELERNFQAVSRGVGRPAAAKLGSVARRQELIGPNDAFHAVIHRAADNQKLERAIADVQLALPRHLTSGFLLEDDALIAANLEEHARVREGLEGHDPVATRAAMTAHVLRAGELVAAWLQRRGFSADGGRAGGR